jgi:hypothetical protein
MDARDYLSAKWYMNTCCNVGCGKCQLSQSNNNTDCSCVELERVHISKAIEIVETWANENPTKWTRIP